MIVKDFNSFKTENPNEIVYSIKQLSNKGCVISLSPKKDYTEVNARTMVAYDPTQKLVKGFVVNGEKYKVYNLERKGQWYNSWFGLIILKEGQPVYVVFLYERKGTEFDEARGILTLKGLEENVTIFFDNGEVKRSKN
jgi:hypothetical protein